MDVERRSGTYHFGVEEGLQQGLEQGLEQGRKALVEVLFELLTDRGIAVDEQSETQIRGCTDLATLTRWLKRAVHATSVEQLLEQ
jgi:flagellar biosynthesis/type III secretory pathway protein FliH